MASLSSCCSEAQLENAEIIADGGGSKNVVVLGSKVTLLDVDMNEEEEWLIGGTTEASCPNVYVWLR